MHLQYAEVVGKRYRAEDTGEKIMADGSEEREEARKRRELEEREDRQDRLDRLERERRDESEPERGGS
jgi:hypothetical protein